MAQLPLGAYLEIPRFNGKIILDLNQSQSHIGKREIRNCSSLALSDPNLLNSVSSVRKDSSGKVIKEQFLITYSNGNFSIQDPNSTNGTYLGTVNLKQAGPQVLKDGDQIIIPIEEKGKLVQLVVIFHIAKNISELQVGDEPEYFTPQYSSSQSAPSPSSSSSTPQYNAPFNSASSSGSSLNNNAGSVSNNPQYFDPQSSSPRLNTTPAGVSSVPISPSGNSSFNAQYNDPLDQTDTSGSFIMVQQQIDIPPNAFSPNSGIDLSMVYKLEKSELWHILMAFFMLMAMVYHTSLNINLIFLITGQVPFDALTFFVLPLPLGLIFGLTFIVHELAHLNTGKHFEFQSRFCLTKVGVKTTLIAILIGIPFGLPGAAVSVGVDPTNDRDKMGWIKFAGPLSNLILGCLFFIVGAIIPQTSEISFNIKLSVLQGASLNFVLGAFNMIPKSIKGFALDGEFIIKWKKKYYFALLGALIIGIIFVIWSIDSYQNAYNMAPIISNS